MKTIASRYAEVLLQLAVEKNVLTRIYKDIVYFDQICTANKRLVITLKNPIIEHKKKLSVLETIFQNEVHSLTLRFFAMVTQKHREALLPSMAQAFLAHYDQHQRVKNAQVTTAFPLSEQLALQLQQMAQKIAPCRHVTLDQNIDTTLIGGYVLRVDDKLLDRSLRKQLLTLQKSCVATGYETKRL